MTLIYQALLGWLPAVIQVPILALFTILIVKLVLHIVKIVLDALPFL